MPRLLPRAVLRPSPPATFRHHSPRLAPRRRRRGRDPLSCPGPRSPSRGRERQLWRAHARRACRCRARRRRGRRRRCQSVMARYDVPANCIPAPAMGAPSVVRATPLTWVFARRLSAAAGCCAARPGTVAGHASRRDRQAAHLTTQRLANRCRSPGGRTGSTGATPAERGAILSEFSRRAVLTIWRRAGKEK